MKNNILTFRPNIYKLKKFWIRKIKENGRTIESGSFNQEQYEKYLQAIK